MRAKSKVRLTIRATQFVCSEEQLDDLPDARTLVLPAVTFQKAVALAETRKGFRAPSHQFLPRHTNDFAVALKQAMNEKVEVGGRRPSSRFTPLGTLREFFDEPLNRRALAKLLDFVQGGGVMDVTNE